MDAIIIKVGGSSSRDAQSIGDVVNIALEHFLAGDNPILVPSAMGVIPGSGEPKVTDSLLLIADEAIKGNYRKDIIRFLREKHEAVERHYGIEGASGQIFYELEQDAQASINSKLPPFQIRDSISRHGERAIAPIYQTLIEVISEKMGKAVKSVVVDTSKFGGFITDSNFGDAALLPCSLERTIADYFIDLRNHFGHDGIPIYTGYIARDSDGHATTFGRNGSNTTALALGAALKANGIIFYSDEPVLVVDRKYVEGAQTVRQLSYPEILAAAKWGVNVFQANSLRILEAKQRLPPIYMRSTRSFNFDDAHHPLKPDTLISPDARGSGMKGIGVMENIGFMEFPVGSLAQYEAVVGSLSTYSGVAIIRSELVRDDEGMAVRLLLATDPKYNEAKDNPQYYRARLMQTIVRDAFGGKEPKGRVRLSRAVAVTAVGKGIGNSSRDRATIENVIAQSEFPPEVAGLKYHLPALVNANSVSVVVPRQVAGGVISGLYRQLKKVNLVVYGPGRIGLKFLERVVNEYDSLGLSVVGIADAKGYVAGVCGLTKEELDKVIRHKEGGKGLAEFRSPKLQGQAKPIGVITGETLAEYTLEKIASMSTGDFILVDASDNSTEMRAAYHAALEAGMKIDTINKLPFVYSPKISFTEYEREFVALYEAILNEKIFNRGTVGANLGAPDTLLRILKENPPNVTIHMMASGTLGLVCSETDGKGTLSDSVRLAIEKGLTEPLPYTDFSGQDMFNKSVIMGGMAARHYGAELRIRRRQPFLHDAARLLRGKVDLELLSTLEGNDFAEATKPFDPAFERLKARAGDGFVLRYIATIEPAKNGNYYIDMGLRAVHRSSIMGSSKGTENVFLFGVNGQEPKPYFPSGPGAGPDITADALMAGVHKFVKEFRS